MQKNSRHFSEVRPRKIGVFPREEKQFSQPTRPRKLLDHVCDVLRVNHYSVRTEEAYVGWIRRFILFHGKKHPREMGALEVELFLTHLAVGENVSSSTQKQALNALVFLYHRVLQKPLGQFHDIERPKRPQRRPLVLSKAEVERLLAVMTGTHQLIATLLFGTGMRLLECLRLRVKDVDLALNQIVVRDGKGWKDRVTMLPQRIKPILEAGSAVAAGARDSQRRSERGTRPSLFARSAEPKTSYRQSAMGVAVCFSSADSIERSAHGRNWPASFARKFGAKSRKQSSAPGEAGQTGNVPHIAAFICNGAAHLRLRYSHRSGIAGPQRREHDHDLHPRAEQAGNRGEKPARLKLGERERVYSERNLRRCAAECAGEGRCDVGRGYDLLGRFFSWHFWAGWRRRARRVDQAAVLDDFFKLRAVERFKFQ